MASNTNAQKGLVLVWDMDSTLVGNYIDPKSNVEILFNERALAILKMAIEARKIGKVSAIFLLTNNSDLEFIGAVLQRLAVKLATPKVFDYVMDRYHSRRPLMMDPPKRLLDVEFMMDWIQKPKTNLANRVYFFDDRRDHIIRSEIPSDHYITITPPFGPNVNDKTNFKPIQTAIAVATGGRRKTRHRRRYRAKTKRRQTVFSKY